MRDASVALQKDGSWLFSWEAGTPPYQIWLNGVLIASPTTNSYVFALPGYETLPPDLEILNAGDFSDSENYPPFVLLQWRGVQGCAGYVVQQATGLSANPWANVGWRREDRSGYYQWQSQALPDDAIAEFRVLPVDLAGNQGTEIDFTLTVVRTPPHPSVALSINSSGAIVVSAGP